MSAPTKYKPMLISDGDVPEGEDWVYQIKWDGIRCIAYIDGDNVKLTSRNGQDISLCFPEVVDALQGLELHDSVFDGEIVVTDDNKPSFAKCLVRSQTTAPIKVKMLRAEYPAAYIFFDCLKHEGTDLVQSHTLRNRLSKLDWMRLASKCSMVGIVFEHLADVQNLVARQNHEGFVAKNLNALYEQDARPSTNVRWKNINTLDGVIYGYEKGDGVRYRDFGAFLCRDTENQSVTFKVSSGFSDAILKEIIDSLNIVAENEDIARCVPDIVIEVKHLDIGPFEEVRNPSFHRIRADKIFEAEAGS